MPLLLVPKTIVIGASRISLVSIHERKLRRRRLVITFCSRLLTGRKATLRRQSVDSYAVARVGPSALPGLGKKSSHAMSGTSSATTRDVRNEAMTNGGSQRLEETVHDGHGGAADRPDSSPKEVHARKWSSWRRWGKGESLSDIVRVLRERGQLCQRVYCICEVGQQPWRRTISASAPPCVISRKVGLSTCSCRVSTAKFVIKL